MDPFCRDTLFFLCLRSVRRWIAQGFPPVSSFSEVAPPRVFFSSFRLFYGDALSHGSPSGLRQAAQLYPLGVGGKWSCLCDSPCFGQLVEYLAGFSYTDDGQLFSLRRGRLDALRHHAPCANGGQNSAPMKYPLRMSNPTVWELFYFFARTEVF